MKKQQRYMIVSMHRSGSSLLSALLQNSLNNKWSAKDSDAFNISGYNESQELIKLNDSVFNAQGLNWFNQLNELPVSVKKTVENGYQELIANLKDELVLKDPRVLNVLAKLNFLDLDIKFILISRDPAEVFRSIKRRNGFEDEVIHAYIKQSLIDQKIIYERYSPVEINYLDLLDANKSKDFFVNTLDINYQPLTDLSFVNKRKIYLSQIRQSFINDIKGFNFSKITKKNIINRINRYYYLIKSIIK